MVLVGVGKEALEPLEAAAETIRCFERAMSMTDKNSGDRFRDN